MNPNRMGEFERAAQNQGEANIVIEFWQFLRANKKWWLLPILAVLLMFGVLAVLSSTGAGPFIYTLF